MTELTNLYIHGHNWDGAPSPSFLLNCTSETTSVSWQAQCSSSDATVQQMLQEIEHLRTEVVQVLLFLSRARWPNETGVH